MSTLVLKTPGSGPADAPRERRADIPRGVESAIEGLLGAVREAAPLVPHLSAGAGLARDLQELERYASREHDIPYGLVAVLPKAVAALAQVGQAQGAYREMLASTLDALMDLFPLAQPGFVLSVWRAIGEEGIFFKRHLLGALPPAAARALDGSEVLALLPDTGPQSDRSLEWMAPFLDRGATGVPDADVLIFRRLVALNPGLAAGMLATVPGVGALLETDEVATLLESSDPLVRSRVIEQTAALRPQPRLS